MNVRPIPLWLGILAFLVGIAALTGLVVIDAVAGLLIVIGAAIVIAATRVLFLRRGSREQLWTPDPEHRNTVPVPGERLVDAVDPFRHVLVDHDVTSRRPSSGPSRHIVAGLHGAAIAVLTRFDGLSPGEAIDRIEAGSWTDDPHAGAFLSHSIEDPPRPLRERAAIALDRGTRFRIGVRRTAAAIAAIGYGTTRTNDRRTHLPSYDGAERETITPRTTTERVDGVVEQRRYRTGYWTGISLVALIAIGVGAIAQSPALVLAGTVGIGYAGFSRAMDARTPTISLDRTLSDDEPEPGDEVDVVLTITNESTSMIPDLRLIDGVPAGLAVTDGAVRIGTTLRPTESVTLEYTLTARRGRHEFDPAFVVTRDLSNSVEREFLVGCETTIVCEPVMRPVDAPVPLRAAAATFAGRLTMAEGGAGTEFHSVREYRHSDPLNRIDWNRHARTGELTTLQFHEERAARILILIDGRKAAYVAPDPDEPHAVDRSVDAAGRIASTLLARGDTVGLAALGPVDRADGSDPQTTESCWLAPASGHHHEVRIRELLATHPQFSTLPPETKTPWLAQLRSVHHRLSSETQVVLFSPLCDRVSGEIARRLDARGHAVTVVSPDPTAERTTGQQLAGVGRRIASFDLQRAGIPVVNWSHGETIDETFARARAGRVSR